MHIRIFPEGEQEEKMKFLVIWELDLALLKNDLIKAVSKMPQYAAKIKSQGKLIERYHLVGKHGGAWIYDVDSNEELERLLAISPVYNFCPGVGVW